MAAWWGAWWWGACRTHACAAAAAARLTRDCVHGVKHHGEVWAAHKGPERGEVKHLLEAGQVVGHAVNNLHLKAADLGHTNLRTCGAAVRGVAERMCARAGAARGCARWLCVLCVPRQCACAAPCSATAAHLAEVDVWHVAHAQHVHLERLAVNLVRDLLGRGLASTALGRSRGARGV
jgi:hypothetical protein